MNKDIRRYFNKLGMLYRKFIPGGGYFGARIFTLIDEYYFNDRHYDTQYKVGINLGKFKFITSNRADIEVSLYIKESLILVDHISKILTNSQDGEITNYSQKSFYYKEGGKVKLEVEALVLIKRRSINDYAFGIVYRDLEGNVVDKFQIDLDRYDLIELHNLLRSFSQISYNLIMNLAVGDFYSNINADTKAKRNISDTLSFETSSSIPDNVEIPISIENIDECDLNLDEIESFGLKVPNLTSIDIKVDQDTINQIANINLETVKDKVIETESSDMILDDFKNDIFGDEAEDELPDEENIESTSTDDNIVENESDESNSVIDNNSNEEVTDTSENDDSSEIDYAVYQDKFGDNLFNVILNNYKFDVNDKHKTVILKELDQQTIIMFEKTLLNAINIIRNYNLSAYNIKPAFIILFFNIDIKETIDRLKVSYDDRGLYYLLQALLIVNRTKADDIMFKQEQQSLIQERVEEMLNELTTIYQTRFNDNSKYHYILNQHFKKVD